MLSFFRLATATLSVIITISFAADVYLTIDGTSLNYESTEDIYGWQFSHNGCAENAMIGCSISGFAFNNQTDCEASFGTWWPSDSQEAGFTESCSETTCLAFSFSGDFIPTGSGLLIDFGLDENGEPSTCTTIHTISVSGEGGENLDVELLLPPCSDNDNPDACNDYGCWWEPSNDSCIDDEGCSNYNLSQLIDECGQDPVCSWDEISGCVLGADHIVEVGNMSFSPADLDVEVGETVEWVWVDGVHNVNGSRDTFPDNANSFFSGFAESDGRYPFTFNIAGHNDYQCDPHYLSMVGTITVGTGGCTDESACNYDADADFDDGSCLLQTPCPIDVQLEFQPAGVGMVDVMYTSSEDIYGFQFDIYHPQHLGDISITDVSGGAVDEEGLLLSFSDNANYATILGFSLELDYIPAGSGVLTTLSYCGSGNACFEGIIISDSEGDPLSSEDNGCFDFPLGIPFDDDDDDGVCDAVDDCVGAFDECDVCNGGGVAAACDCEDTSGLNDDGCCDDVSSDCNNVCGGSSVVDECGVCDGSGIAEGECNCAGHVDLGCGCGVAGPSGCDNACGSTAVVDECGVCGGDNSTCEPGVFGLFLNADGNLDVTYNIPEDIYAFQFDITGGISVTGTVDCDEDDPECIEGAASDAGYLVYTGNNTVVGVNFNLAPIEHGSGILTVLTFERSGYICISNLVVSDALGVSMYAITDDCIDVNCDDADADDLCDDIDDCVGSYDICGICNGDGIPDGSCDCAGNVLDCHDNCGGDAEIDECGVCGGGGIQEGECDCDGLVEQNYWVDNDGDGFGSGEAVFGCMSDLPGTVTSYDFIDPITGSTSHDDGLQFYFDFGICEQGDSDCYSQSINPDIINPLFNLEIPNESQFTSIVVPLTANNLDYAIDIFTNGNNDIGRLKFGTVFGPAYYTRQETSIFYDCGTEGGCDEGSDANDLIGSDIVGVSFTMSFNMAVSDYNSSLYVNIHTLDQPWVTNDDDADDSCATNDDLGCGCGEPGIADGACDCDGNVLDCANVCGGDATDAGCGCGEPGIAPGACDCAGNVDLGCGCDEPGIADGACDCAGNVLDCANVCGGDALDVGCGCAEPAPDALGLCGGSCQLDEDDDGFCDDEGCYDHDAMLISVLGFDGATCENVMGMFTCSDLDEFDECQDDENWYGTPEEICYGLDWLQIPELNMSHLGNNIAHFCSCMCDDYPCVDIDTDNICDFEDDCLGNIFDECGVCDGDGSSCGGVNNPNWQDDPGAYEFVATMTAAVFDGGVQLEDLNDILAAFDDAGNVRGITNQLPLVSWWDGTIMHEITIRGNGTGENIKFKFYDASEDVVLDLSESYSFVINEIVGSQVDPYPLSVKYGVDLSIDLIAGWNWISINVLPEDPSVGSVLGDLGLNADFINSQADGASQNYASQGGPWAGSFTAFEPGNMYLLKMLEPATLVVTGVPVDVATTSINLIAGWNWLGYLPQNPGPVGVLLESLGQDADFINSQADGASQNYASQGGPWAGSLTALESGKGYLLKMLSPATFTYPELDGLVRLAENKQEVILSQKISDWDFNYGDYQFIGTITASIESHEDADGDVVGVFVDGKCRGLAERMYFPLDDTYYYMIQVHSNEIDGEALTFKYYDKANDEVIEYSETLTFENNMIVGDGFNTFGLSRDRDLSQPKAYSISDAYPNPFNPVTSFEYTIPEDGLVQVAIYDVNGRMVSELINGYQSAGTYPVVWDAQELSSGIYMVNMIAGDYSTIQKVMFVK